MATIFREILKEIAAEVIVGKSFGARSLRNLLSVGVEQTTPLAPGTPPPTPPAGFPKITWGGFDLSDETAWFGLEGKMRQETDGPKKMLKISKFINKRLTKTQRGRFRISVGYLGAIEHTVEVGVVTRKIPQGKGKSPIVEEEHTQKIGNLGVDFLSSFAECTEEEMIGVCETSGVLDPTILEKLAGNKKEIIKDIQNLRKRIRQEDYRDSKKKTVKGTHYRGALGEILEPWKKILRSIFFSRKKRS